MSIDFNTPWGAVINATMNIIERVLPDPAAKAAAQAQVMQLAATQELADLKARTDLALAQIATNTTEAQSTNWFTSGWRPGAGWVCVAGLLYEFLLQPLMAWGSTVWHIPAPPPIDTGTLLELLAGMLGLGTLRSVDKAKGVAS